jgi:hypothetical protein
LKFLRPELVADRSVPESVGGWMFDQAIWRCGQHAGVISTRGFVLLLQEDNHDQAELSQKVQTLHTACCNPLGSTLRIESGYHCISPSTGKCVENVGTRSIEFRGFRNCLAGATEEALCTVYFCRAFDPDCKRAIKATARRMDQRL